VDARNSLEGYLYNLKNQLEDEEKGIAGKVDEDDKATLQTAVSEALEWLESNQDADAEEYKEQLKGVEKVANPIMQKVYQSSGGAPPSGSGGDEGDFAGEEL
jgi:heat shock protein 5